MMMRGGLGTPDTPIYSLGILGYKRPQVGVFFLTVHPSTRVTQAYGPIAGSRYIPLASFGEAKDKMRILIR